MRLVSESKRIAGHADVVGQIPESTRIGRDGDGGDRTRIEWCDRHGVDGAIATNRHRDGTGCATRNHQQCGIAQQHRLTHRHGDIDRIGRGDVARLQHRAQNHRGSHPIVFHRDTIGGHARVGGVIFGDILHQVYNHRAAGQRQNRESKQGGIHRILHKRSTNQRTILYIHIRRGKAVDGLGPLHGEYQNGGAGWGGTGIHIGQGGNRSHIVKSDTARAGTVGVASRINAGVGRNTHRHEPGALPDTAGSHHHRVPGGIGNIGGEIGDGAT